MGPEPQYSYFYGTVSGRTSTKWVSYDDDGTSYWIRISETWVPSPPPTFRPLGMGSQATVVVDAQKPRFHDSYSDRAWGNWVEFECAGVRAGASPISEFEHQEAAEMAAQVAQSLRLAGLHAGSSDRHPISNDPAPGWVEVTGNQTLWLRVWNIDPMGGNLTGHSNELHTKPHDNFSIYVPDPKVSPSPNVACLKSIRWRSFPFFGPVRNVEWIDHLPDYIERGDKWLIDPKTGRAIKQYDEWIPDIAARFSEDENLRNAVIEHGSDQEIEVHQDVGCWRIVCPEWMPWSVFWSRELWACYEAMADVLLSMPSGRRPEKIEH